MNRFGPHRLMCVYAWSTGSALTLRRSVLVIIGVSLLGKCVTVGVGFEGS